jgi:hypothetical protein
MMLARRLSYLMVTSPGCAAGASERLRLATARRSNDVRPALAHTTTWMIHMLHSSFNADTVSIDKCRDALAD